MSPAPRASASVEHKDPPPKSFGGGFDVPFDFAQGVSVGQPLTMTRPLLKSENGMNGSSGWSQKEVPYGDSPARGVPVHHPQLSRSFTFGTYTQPPSVAFQVSSFTPSQRYVWRKANGVVVQASGKLPKFVAPAVPHAAEPPVPACSTCSRTNSMIRCAAAYARRAWSNVNDGTSPGYRASV